MLTKQQIKSIDTVLLGCQADISDCKYSISYTELELNDRLDQVRAMIGDIRIDLMKLLYNQKTS